MSGYYTTNIGFQLFEAALGIPADMLIGVQIDYNIRMANQDKSFTEPLAQAAML
ncbi:MAG: hypothetical protein LBU22_02860 [Dysgonamonadaceae bacterium]|nr:hypothetical protein [Dysgonamonadaceae bacterium]